MSSYFIERGLVEYSVINILARFSQLWKKNVHYSIIANIINMIMQCIKGRWCLITPVYPCMCVLASDVNRARDLSIGRSVCYPRANRSRRSARVLLWCDVEFLYENCDVLKNKQVSTFLSKNLISMKSRSREVFGKNCDLITPIITHSDWPN